MDDDKERDAENTVRALLGSVGLRPNASRDGESAPVTEPVARRSSVAADVAFAGIAQVDRVEAAKRRDRAVEFLNTARKEFESELTDFLSKQYGVPAIKPQNFQVRDDVLALIPGELASAYGVVPVNVAGDLLIVATYDPSNEYLLEAVSRFTGFTVEPVVAALPDLDEAIALLYQR